MSKLEELREKYKDEFKAESYIYSTGGGSMERWNIVSFEENGVDYEGNIKYWTPVIAALSELDAWEELDSLFTTPKPLDGDDAFLY